MIISDLFKMCRDSLMRRKGRTFLTALGVFIGCTSIILMVSVGAAMSETQEQSIARMGDLTIIQVYPSSSAKSNVKLDDKAFESFRQIDGVKAVMPKYRLDEYIVEVSASNERYKTDWAQLVGVDVKYMEDMSFKLNDGKFPSSGGDERTIFVAAGQDFAYSFVDTYKSEMNNRIDKWSFMYDEEGNYNPDAELPDPFFDPLKETMKIKISTMEENPKSTSMDMKAIGVLKEDYSKGWETSEGLFVDTAAFKTLVSKMTGTSPAAVKLTPSEVLVKAADINKVAEIESAIKAQGYNTSSMQSFREEMAKQARNTELMLGGLGAISLFVAAIGIANTMIMSITERTKEIGIMKALGCYVKDIRTLFLMEAGCIGLIGGICGIVFSIIASVIANLVSMGVFPMGITGETIMQALIGGENITRRSAITPALIIFAIFFSIAIGVISGYYPANKAVKISALEAIKNE